MRVSLHTMTDSAIVGNHIHNNTSLIPGIVIRRDFNMIQRQSYIMSRYCGILYTSSKSKFFSIVNRRSYTSIDSLKLAVESLPSIQQIVQSKMFELHDFSGLPWWLTLVTSTVFVRISLLPLVRLQANSILKLSKAGPDLSILYQLLVKRHQIESLPIFNSLQLFGIFLKGSFASFRLHEVSITSLLLYPTINISAFVTYILSLREIIFGPNSAQFEDGGFSWFLDLTEKDPTLVLPLLSISLSYLAIGYSFHQSKGKQNYYVTLFQDGLQCLLIICIPLYMQLPCGVFCYLIPSSIFSLIQTRLFRTPSFRRFIRLHDNETK